MGNHSVTFVPINTWCYQSPELKYIGKQIDIGLLSESLLYYDQVIINVPSEEQFVELVNWFISQGAFSEFINLIEDEIIRFYNYAFVSAPILLPNGNYDIKNIQDDIHVNAINSFEVKYLDQRWLDKLHLSNKFKKRLKNALSNKVIEVKASNFANPIYNAKDDFRNETRNSLTLQALIDNTYDITKLKKPFEINTTIVVNEDGSHQANYNFDFKQLSTIFGEELNFHNGTPLAGMVVCNNYIQSAMDLKSDLYLSSPISNLVGNKLYESAYKIIKSKQIIESLEGEVEFPNIRVLINSGKLGFKDILTIRKKSDKFRNWLQEEGEHDRNAIIAYHHEVAKESGYERGNRIGISIFGVLSSATLGIISETVTGGTAMGLLGQGVTAGGSFLTKIIANMGKDWKPVIFGNWMRDRIEKIIDDERNNS